MVRRSLIEWMLKLFHIFHQHYPDSYFCTLKHLFEWKVSEEGWKKSLREPNVMSRILRLKRFLFIFFFLNIRDWNQWDLTHFCFPIRAICNIWSPQMADSMHLWDVPTWRFRRFKNFSCPKYIYIIEAIQIYLALNAMQKVWMRKKDAVLSFTVLGIYEVAENTFTNICNDLQWGILPHGLFKGYYGLNVREWL